MDKNKYVLAYAIMVIAFIVTACDLKLVVLLQLTVLTVYIFLYGKTYLVRLNICIDYYFSL